MFTSSSRILRFDVFTLDAVRSVLLRGGAELPLRQQSFDVLRHLAEHQGKVLSSDELVAAVWTSKPADHNASVAQCIREIRQALGDDARWVIKTVSGRGYEFKAEVVPTEPSQAPVGGVGVVREERQPTEVGEADPKPEKPAPLPLPDKPSIAVLAFTNMSGDPDQGYFSDGITEDIITGLSRFSELFVIARNSSFQYKGKSPDIRQVGRELGVRYVLEGSIRCAGDRVRISAQLVDAVTGAHRWGERYDRELRDVFAVQDEVSRAIVAILVAHVNKAEAERTLLKPPETWQAYDFFMRASDLFSTDRPSVAGLYEARRLLERSIALDPN